LPAVRQNEVQTVEREPEKTDWLASLGTVLTWIVLASLGLLESRFQDKAAESLPTDHESRKTKYAFKPIAVQALRPNQTVVTQRLIGALP